MGKSFTPGPWHEGCGNGTGSVFADRGRMRLEDRGTTLFPICSVVTGWDESEDQANARLIAAAPELLEALIQARAALPDSWSAVKCGVPREVIDLINSAISKATGGAE